KKPRRLTESTTEVLVTDNSTSNDTPPEGNRVALAEYPIVDVDLPPSPQLIHTSSPVIPPRLIQPMGLRPHSVLTEQRLSSPINVPSSSFLQPIPSTSAYTPPALFSDPSHQQLLLLIKEELGRIFGKLPNFIMTDVDFDELGKFLSEDGHMNCFVQCMSQLSGTSEGELLRNILSRNIHGDYANNISISGLNGKRSLKGTKLYTCIKMTIRTIPAFSSATDVSNNSAIREWLHNPRSRKTTSVRWSYQKNNGVA
ncbi:hypothetical protein EG68_12524, partial [Paragonimus skrjabini miyazakii]